MDYTSFLKPINSFSCDLNSDMSYVQQPPAQEINQNKGLPIYNNNINNPYNNNLMPMTMHMSMPIIKSSDSGLNTDNIVEKYNNIMELSTNNQSTINQYKPLLDELAEIGTNLKDVSDSALQHLNSIRNTRSKTKNEDISKMYQSYASLVNTRVSVIKDYKEILKLVNESDIKRFKLIKEHNIAAEGSNVSDEALMLSLYEKLINSGTGNDSNKYLDKIITPTADETPEEVIKSYEEYVNTMKELNMKNVVVYNNDTQTVDFKAMTTSGDIIDGKNLPPASLLDDLIIDKENRTARHKYLGDIYDLVIVDSLGNIIYN